jgi:cysteine desulfurase family protein (TIGR01976 family)
MAPSTAEDPRLSALRARFPALQRRQAGHPVAYFDGPGGTQVPGEVADTVAGYLLRHNANTHWAFPTSGETDALLAAARAALADLLGGAPDEIVFGANMTTLTFHLGRALGREWGPDDEIVVTELDHHANVAPWRALERERGVAIRVVPMDPRTGTLATGALEAALARRPRLLAIGAASNALGTITDVARAAAAARAAGTLVFVDAVHLVPHQLVDVARDGYDFLACSAYKFYGPHVGVLWGARDRLAALDPPRLDPAPDTVPERVESGTLNHEGIVGAAAAVDFLASLGTGDDRRARLQDAFAWLHLRGETLVRRLWDGLTAIPGVRPWGPPPGQPRTPTVSFTVAGVPAAAVAAALVDDGVFLSHGDFYAATVVERLGLAPDGLVRAGCACYTTEAEVDRLLAGVARIAGPAR